MAPSAEDTRMLHELLTSTLSLLAQFSAVLNPSAPPSVPAAVIEQPPNPLHVLRDSAQLLKAHTTKISLLAITTPFTPSAVHKVLQELAATCLPAMMSAVEITVQAPATWGGTMCHDARLRVRRVFVELAALLEEVRAVAQGNPPRRRGSLKSTGVVWESCDALVELDKLGIVGLAVQKAEQYRDTIQDAIEELREWKEGEDLDSEGRDGLLDSGDEGVEGDRDSLDDIFHAANSMPKGRPELEKLVDEANGKLKKIVLLYTALIKRRFKTFKGEPAAKEAPTGASNVERLDQAMQSLGRIPHQVDELASCFYDLSEERASEQLVKCVGEAKSAAQAVHADWNGAEDGFSAWSSKWQDAVG